MRQHRVHQPLFHDWQQVDGQSLYHRTPLRSVCLPQHGCQAVRRLVLLVATKFSLSKAK